MPAPATARCSHTPRPWPSCAPGSARMRAAAQKPLPYGETVDLGEVDVWPGPGRPRAGLGPGGDAIAGHAMRGIRRLQAPPRPDLRRLRAGACDVFVTEATFGLPVFRHPDRRATRSPGCCTRWRCSPSAATSSAPTRWARRSGSSRLLREAGWDRPIYVHGALQRLNDLYAGHGVDLGELRPATAGAKGQARRTSRARSSSPRPVPSPTAGRAACPTRWSPSPRAGCGSSSAPASAASSCRWSSPTTPTGTSCSRRSTSCGPRGLDHPRPRGGAGARGRPSAASGPGRWRWSATRTSPPEPGGPAGTGSARHASGHHGRSRGRGDPGRRRRTPRILVPSPAWRSRHKNSPPSRTAPI